jgi:antitoxin (DNA-binding transcriptional repressor) of toxin-antitoxin stability system
MLQIFREIELSGEELIVTDRNKPVLRIMPIRHKQSVEEVFGSLDGQVIFLADIDLPTIDEWEFV